MVPLIEAMARKLAAGRLLSWLALVAYLATVGLGGLALHRERTARRRAVDRLDATLEYQEARRALDELVPVLDTATVLPLRRSRPVLRVIRGDAG